MPRPRRLRLRLGLELPHRLEPHAQRERGAPPRGPPRRRRRGFASGRVGHLPRPVELPAVATRGTSLLAIGGLDAADASRLHRSCRVDGGRARVVGHLPSPLHDAAAATARRAARCSPAAARPARAAPQVLRILPGGATQPAARLPAGASDVEAAAVGDTDLRRRRLHGHRAAALDRRARARGRRARGGRDPAPAALRGGRRRRRPGPDRRRHLGDRPRGARSTASIRARGRGAADRAAAAGGHPRRRARRSTGASTCSAGAAPTSPRSARRSWRSIRPAAASRARAGCPRRLSDLSAGSFRDHVTVVGGRDAPAGARRDLVAEVAGVRRLAPLALALVALGGCGGGKTGSAASPNATARATADARRLAVGARRARVAWCRAPGAIPRLLNRRDVYAAERPGRLSPRRPPRPRAGLRAQLRVEHRRRDLAAAVQGHRPLRGRATPPARHPVVGPEDAVGDQRREQLADADRPADRPARPPVPVADPYNLYFTADGRRAIVVAERLRRLDFRSPHTMKLEHALGVPQCGGRRPHGLHRRRPAGARLVRVRRADDRRRPGAREA